MSENYHLIRLLSIANSLRMDETFFVVAKALLCLLPGVWLALGVLDNLRYPDINREDVARVLRLEALKEWPEVMAHVAHRRVDNPTLVRIVFALIVTGELTATVLLLIGGVGLGGAAAGFWPMGDLLMLAQAGALVFTCVWGGMVIGGQWFYYWYGAFGQHTHLLSLIWGLGTLGLLTT